MPKKFAGVNSKAAAAKARKDEKAEADRSRAEQAKEDALWADDDDKGGKKKRERKEREERKRQEAADKKLDRQRLLQEEEEQAGKSKPGGKSAPAPKVTQNDIRLRQERERREAAAAAAAAAKEEQPTHLEGDLPENLNRMGLQENGATNIDEALTVLNGPASAEKHPEKRMKAAYDAFEEERLPQLKQENTNLRLSQLKQMLRKEWMKHPANPMNKNLMTYNARK